MRCCKIFAAQDPHKVGLFERLAELGKALLTTEAELKHLQLRSPGSAEGEGARASPESLAASRSDLSAIRRVCVSARIPA
jgi:hypothetical protein